MKEFEIDVSGEDLLSKNYTICVANKKSIIKGFKFNEELINILSSRYGQGLYKYHKSQKGKALFKIRLYCIIIYYLFQSMRLSGEVSLAICRDFSGREKEIKENLFIFLEKNLGLTTRIHFGKLSPDSNAHKYAYMMRIDSKNKMNTYVKINLEEIEKWLIKK
jgi:hypothetical protein